MFRNIVVAFDGSERARDALALALRLRAEDGVITLACTVTERPWHRAQPDAVAETLATGRAQIPAGIHVRLRTPVASSPARGLTELAEDEHADLVVVGSSRRSPSGRIWLERTAGRLLQGAPCAVAVPPPGCASPSTSITSRSPMTALPRRTARWPPATRSRPVPARR